MPRSARGSGRCSTPARPGARILADFPAVTEACIRAGLDPVHTQIPVAPAAHYHMGGIETDIRGRASLGNLWVCGEASATGLHGANRLASNGLLEALVYADTCATDIARMNAGQPESAPETVIDFPEGGCQPAPETVAKLRQVMTDGVGVVRNRAGMETALREIARIEAAATEHCPALLNMTATATLIAASALRREESRGGHYRSDFPEPRLELARRSRTTLDEALALRTSLAEETA